MVFALRMMKMATAKHQRYSSKITSKVYNKLKKEYSIELSKLHSAKTPWNKGRKQSPEHNMRISNSNTGRPKTAEHRQKISEAKKDSAGTFTGRTHSEETKLKLKEINSKPQPTVTCTHCGKTGGRGNMTRYHFDKCKSLPTLTDSFLTL